MRNALAARFSKVLSAPAKLAVSQNRKGKIGSYHLHIQTSTEERFCGLKGGERSVIGPGVQNSGPLWIIERGSYEDVY